MAEARSAVHEPHVGRIEEGRSAQHDFIVGLRASIIRRFFRTRFVIKGLKVLNIATVEKNGTEYNCMTFCVDLIQMTVVYSVIV